MGAVVTELKYQYQMLIHLNAKNDHCTDAVDTEVSANLSLVLQPLGHKYTAIAVGS